MMTKLRPILSIDDAAANAASVLGREKIDAALGKHSYNTICRATNSQDSEQKPRKLSAKLLIGLWALADAEGIPHRFQQCLDAELRHAKRALNVEPAHESKCLLMRAAQLQGDAGDMHRAIHDALHPNGDGGEEITTYERQEISRATWAFIGKGLGILEELKDMESLPLLEPMERKG